MKTICSLIQRAALLALLSTLIDQPSTCFAQGTAFTYQGRLNEGANPANGAYDLTFTLFNASSGGAVLGATNVFNDLLVSNGLFTVTLDYGAQFDGNARWLQIEVRPGASTGAYTNVTPRQAITSTPYAIRALNFSGTIASAQLSGTYGSAVTFNNAGNSFTGNGAGLTALDANQLASGTVPLARLSGITSNQLDPATWQLATNANGGGPGASGSWTVDGNNVTAGQFLGSTNNQPLEIKVNGVRALRLEPNTSGAPNLIGGSPRNFVGAGAVGAVVAGGGAVNFSGSPYTNSVSSDFGVIGGGANNTIQTNAYDSTIGGGANNTIQTNAYLSAIGGGYNNMIQKDSFYSTIGGGNGNRIQGVADDATIGGGKNNSILLFAHDATIGGGEINTAGARYATVPGGYDNHALGEYSFAAGIGAKANHNGAFVWSDPSISGFASSAENQFLINATGGVGVGTTNPVTKLTVGGSGGFNSLSAAAITLKNTTAPRTWEWHALDDGKMQLADYTAAASRLVIDTAGNVGIGSSSPHHRLRLSGGPSWTSAGWFGALELDYASAIGWNGPGGGWRFGIGQSGGGLYFFQTASDPGTAASAPTYDMIITDAGNVGIGTTSPGFLLEVNGTAGKPGGGSWSVASDERLKKNVRPLAGALDKLLALHGVNFEYIDPAKIHELSGERMGLIAQEVEKVFPDWVETAADGYKRVTVRGLEALVVEALRQLRLEQSEKIASIEQEKNAEIEALKQRLERLEKLFKPELEAGAR